MKILTALFQHHCKIQTKWSGTISNLALKYKRNVMLWENTVCQPRSHSWSNDVLSARYGILPLQLLAWGVPENPKTIQAITMFSNWMGKPYFWRHHTHWSRDIENSSCTAQEASFLPDNFQSTTSFYADAWENSSVTYLQTPSEELWTTDIFWEESQFFFFFKGLWPLVIQPCSSDGLSRSEWAGQVRPNGLLKEKRPWISWEGRQRNWIGALKS